MALPPPPAEPSAPPLAPASSTSAPPPAEELDPAELARIEAFRVRLARKPWVTWALAASIASMFAAQALLGGIDDPWVMIRLGAQVPARIAAGEWWRLISGAFLHSGVIHFALNTWVLLVVGSGLERILGSARFLFAYAFSVVVASLAALALSDAPLTVGASGGVFGLFGVELVVVALRPELLPESIQTKHRRTVLTNLAINVANSFRPNIAMAAHFGGIAAGAVLGLVLVPRTFEDDRAGAPAWVKVGSAIGGLALALGVGLALFHALGDSALPVVARTPLHGLVDPGASAEIPTTLAPVPEHPGTFGELQIDPAVISVSRYLGLGAPPAELVHDLDASPMPAEYRHLGASETRIAGHRAVVDRYEATEAPLVVERVLVREETSAWLVESVYWKAAGSTWDGVAARVAASIQEEPIATGERVALVCDRWSAALPPGATARPIVACGDPVTNQALVGRGITGMVGHLEIGLGSCTLDVHTQDVPVAMLDEAARRAPPEGETFAMEIGAIESVSALRVLTSEAAIVVRFQPSSAEACIDPLDRVRDVMRRTIEAAPLAPGGEVEMSLGATGDRMTLTLPVGAYVTSLGGAPPDASTGEIPYDVTYELRIPGNAARAVWSSDRPRLERGRRAPPIATTLVSPDDTWTDVPDLEGAAGATCAVRSAWLRADRRVSFYLCGPAAERPALRAVLETSRALAPTL